MSACLFYMLTEILVVWLAAIPHMSTKKLFSDYSLATARFHDFMGNTGQNAQTARIN